MGVIKEHCYGAMEGCTEPPLWRSESSGWTYCSIHRHSVDRIRKEIGDTPRVWMPLKPIPAVSNNSEEDLWE